MVEWCLGLILVGLLVWTIWIFNRLIRSRNLVQAAWSDIDVQLVRRHDLIPQLVNVVSAYAAQERKLLTTVAALRSQAIENIRPPTLAALENALEQHLGEIFLLQEAYPNLKSDRHFAQLQCDLIETENLLQYARRFYNGAVRELNNSVEQFPSLIIAKLIGIKKAEFFIAEPEAHKSSRIGME